MKLTHNKTCTILGELPLDHVLEKASKKRHPNKLLHRGNSYSIARMKVFAVHGCKCHYCGLEGTKIILTQDATGDRGLHLDLFAEKDGSYILMNRDHIIPASKGGKNTVWNMRPTCAPCNQKRGNILTKADIRLADTQKHMKRLYHKLCDHTALPRRWCYGISFAWGRLFSTFI